MRRSLLALSFVLALLAAPFAGGSGGDPTVAEYVDGHVLVGFKPGTTAAQRKAALRAAGVTTSEGAGFGIDVGNVQSGTVPEKVAALRARREVAFAEPDYVLHADVTPNDQYYGQLWGLAKIGAPAAWNTTTGSSSIVVGVVDTGIDWTHPDLAANVWSNPGGIGGCAAGTHGYNAIKGNCKPRDDNDHGTHVSGTIGAVGNNGTGVAGVNWSVKLMGLKFLNAKGSGSTSNAVKAIDWAVAAKQAGVNVRVLSNSWGGGGYSQALLDAIDAAGANDILFVVAAGNASANDDTTPSYPCAYNAPNVVCVAATDSTDALASFSNYGPATVDLGAPGVGVLSTVPGGYASYSGTSMATPHVSGAAALILSHCSETVAQLKAKLLSSVDADPSLAGLTVTGGRLDLQKAVTGC
jgi:subtilisin family serine protease